MDFNQLPDKLPVPVDDGAAAHLESIRFPGISLEATSGEYVDIHKLPGFAVFYIYPMTGRPGTPLPDHWDEIPGARGCTPQSCGFRDYYADLKEYDACVYGVSTQSSDYQLEAKKRLHLPFDLLSDSGLKLKEAVNLPTFKTADMELYKRITLIVRDGIVVKTFYPVFPPDNNADEVLEWLQLNA